jgi:hypothetical protein
MLRRRLLSLVGAVGLVAGLLSSGVAAQASTPGPDWTYLGLLATYSWSSQDTCYSNVTGGADTTGGICTITQDQSNKSNIAVCVQNSNSVAPAPVQTCSIRQTNIGHNNYALVIQRIQQSTCTGTTPAPCTATGTQKASIQQTNGSGWNFAGAFQTTTQSIGQRDDDPLQTNTQHVEVLAPSNGPGGLEQVSASGSNFGAVSQSSSQSAFGDMSQTQTAEQVAGNSGSSGSGIDQHAPLGSNAAFLIHIQKQQLDASPIQHETATQDGDITQTGTPGANLASGNQFQDQRENGPLGASQQQTGGPKCCSVQNGGKFIVRLKTGQRAYAGGVFNPAASQSEYLEGNCDSVNGSCDVFLSATEQGNPPQTNTCTTSPCHIAVSCGDGGCRSFTITPDTLPTRPSAALREPSVALLT